MDGTYSGEVSDNNSDDHMLDIHEMVEIYSYEDCYSKDILTLTDVRQPNWIRLMNPDGVVYHIFM